jgi:hypothetical protein
VKDFGSIGRFVTRGTADGRVDLALFFATKDSGLKPNTVYELAAIDGEVVMREVGPSIMRHETYAERRGMPCWGQDVGQVVRQGGRYLVLSEDEYLQMCAAREEDAYMDACRRQEEDAALHAALEEP